MILALSIHDSRAADIIILDDMITDPLVLIGRYRDCFGNWCTRMMAPGGRIRITGDALIRDRRPIEPLPAYAVFVARYGGAPRLVPLGTAQEVDRAVAEWRSEIAREASSLLPASDSEQRCRRRGLALRRAIWDPVAREVAGARRIFVVRDGALHLVNFAALPCDGRTYLIDSGLVFHHLTSERDLVQKSWDRPGTGLLALGGPAFN